MNLTIQQLKTKKSTYNNTQLRYSWVYISKMNLTTNAMCHNSQFITTCVYDVCNSTNNNTSLTQCVIWNVWCLLLMLTK